MNHRLHGSKLHGSIGISGYIGLRTYGDQLSKQLPGGTVVRTTEKRKNGKTDPGIHPPDGSQIEEIT